MSGRRYDRHIRPVPTAPSPAAKEGELPANPHVRWFKADEDLGGALILSGATERAVAQLALELKHTDDFLRAGLDPSTKVLFSGPSGTGKTLAARWLGWSLALPVAVIDISTIVGSYIGETSERLGACFACAASVPSLLFLDEIDAICMRRDMAKNSSGAELARVTTTFLQQVDWLRPSRIVIAATNFRDELDSALRRRLTTEIPFELPDRDARARMLAHWFDRVPLESSILEELLDATEGLSGADVRSRGMTVARAALLARLPPVVQLALAKSPASPAAMVKPAIQSAQELLEALERIAQSS